MNECILVVDDDPEIVRAIAILLEKEGYQVLKRFIVKVLSLLKEYYPTEMIRKLVITVSKKEKADGISYENL